MAVYGNRLYFQQHKINNNSLKVQIIIQIMLTIYGDGSSILGRQQPEYVSCPNILGTMGNEPEMTNIIIPCH